VRETRLFGWKLATRCKENVCAKKFHQRSRQALHKYLCTLMLTLKKTPLNIYTKTARHVNNVEIIKKI
jgi:hypothetical protein